MSEGIQFEFKAMPELERFIAMYPLLKDNQYRAPFFVGCLFSYAEYLQKDSSRLGVYNWLGTMTLAYDDIVNGLYHKVLNYIKNKEKIIESARLGELTQAIAYYDNGRCDNDRVALTAFCHGWAVGRSFILRTDMVSKIKKKMKELNIEMTDKIKKYLNENKERINKKENSVLEEFLELIPEN